MAYGHRFGAKSVMASVNNIEKLRLSRGWSRPALAKLMGTSYQQIERLEKGDRQLSQKWIDRAAAAFGVEPAAIITPSDEIPASNVIVAQFEKSGPTEAIFNDLPIFGTALGAPKIIEGDAIEQIDLNQGEILGYAKRPAILQGKKDAYALYVQGSSMYPAFSDGDLIAAQRNAPLRIGDDVIVYLRPDNPNDDDGERARCVLLKKLVRRSASYIELEQFSPHLVFKIEMNKVLRVDRVLSRQDMLA